MSITKQSVSELLVSNIAAKGTTELLCTTATTSYW